MTEMVRTHVVLPKDLVDAIDAIAGPRKRSEYVAEVLTGAVAAEHRRKRVYEAALRAAGSIPEGDVPEWDTDEGVRNWLKELREEKSNRSRSIDAAWAESDAEDLAASQPA